MPGKNLNIMGAHLANDENYAQTDPFKKWQLNAKIFNKRNQCLAG